jgi:hypothetical protein
MASTSGDAGLLEVEPVVDGLGRLRHEARGPRRPGHPDIHKLASEVQQLVAPRRARMAPEFLERILADTGGAREG